MDIYKFTLTYKHEDYEAIIGLDYSNDKRKKNIQRKRYDKVRNQGKRWLS